ncbi:MAG: ribose-phosphate diphosphokinase [Polyangiaceae bacterium]|jgi:ribose-phosphate pyrophosphokinase|nr:ribose-phosphate diphosphokinase [Polyangiaceae bacterium]
MTSPPLALSTASYAYLRDDLCSLAGLAHVQVEERRFPDGERYLRLLDDVFDRDVVLVGGTTSDEDTLELYDLACAVVKYGARRLTLILPYFGYSTMERAVRPGEVVTAKTRARLLSSIPPSSMGNEALLLDLHSEGIPHYFEGALTAFHVRGTALITAAARRLVGHNDEFVLASTDAGRAKTVEHLANELRVPASFVYKRRLDGGHTEVTGVSAQVQGQDVVIYDDMIRTGSSLENAARAYLQAGARRIFAVATHGLFPGDALERLQRSGLFQAILCTDSHPRALARAGSFLQVERVAPLFLPLLRMGQG